MFEDRSAAKASRRRVFYGMSAWEAITLERQKQTDYRRIGRSQEAHAAIPARQQNVPCNDNISFRHMHLVIRRG